MAGVRSSSYEESVVSLIWPAYKSVNGCPLSSIATSLPSPRSSAQNTPPGHCSPPRTRSRLTTACVVLPASCDYIPTVCSPSTSYSSDQGNGSACRTIFCISGFALGYHAVCLGSLTMIGVTEIESQRRCSQSSDCLIVNCKCCH